MAIPTLENLKAVNDVETGYSVLIRNFKYAGLELLPPFQSNVGPNQSGTFWKYDIRDFLKSGDVKRALTGYAKEIGLKPTTDTFTTSMKAARTDMIDVLEMYADPSVRPSRTATILVVNELLLGHEKEVAALATNTAIMTQNITLSGTSQFSDFNNSDPLDVFSDARMALSYVPYNMGMPNARMIAIMPPEVFEILRQHPDVQNVYSNTDGILQADNLAAVIGVNRVIVAEAWKDTADDAAASMTRARVWNKDIVIAYVNPSKEEQTMSFGFTVFSRMPGTAGISPEFAAGTPIRVRDYREEGRGGGTNWRESDSAWDLKIVSAEFGYLIKNAVA